MDSMIVIGSSVRGLSLVMTANLGKSAGNFAHDRTLRAVPVSAAAKHADHAPFRELLHGL